MSDQDKSDGSITEDYEYIQNLLNHFILHNEVYKKDIRERKLWIPDELMYGQKTMGGFNMIKVDNFLYPSKQVGLEGT